MSDDVCICIPTLNEVSAISEVITDFRDEGYENILVLDGGSTDGTRDTARDAGARVHTQTFSGGKGAAMQEAMDVIDAPIVVFIDGDATYEPAHTPRLVDPIQNGDSDHVLGNRFAKMTDGAMSPTHQFGNRMINLFFGLVHGQYVGDVLTGFRAITQAAYQDINVESTGFGIETELTARSIRNGATVTTVPTTYYSRKGQSELRGVRDGVRIGYRTVEARLRSG